MVAGNEVLLRGDMTAENLASTIRAVKTRVHVPVTYADVWEYWLRNPDIAAAVDFVTIHILPYWEDFPIPARNAAAHVDAIRRKVVAAFPGKEVLIGEVGWPSAGRMREGALPSPANQARVIQDVLALAAREKFHVNVIEAYDQPWKRALEGTVGGHWGLLDAATRERKFAWGQPVSNHPLWRWQAAGGIVFALIVFGAAFLARRKAPPALWLGVAVNATAGGLLIGWTLANVPIESLGVGGWLRSRGVRRRRGREPARAQHRAVRGMPVPRFSQILGPAGERIRDPLALASGVILIVSMLLAIESALGLVFDPRYRDFPFAPLTAAAVPFAVQSLCLPRASGKRGTAEVAGASVLALSVPYIALNEGLANWQSLWLMRGLCRARLQSGSGARRARLSTNRPTDERRQARYYTARCRSRRARAPRANNTSDGRNRLSAATISAAIPNTEYWNSAAMTRRVVHSQVLRPAAQARPTLDCSSAV